MSHKPYPSDLTDAQWAVLEPMIPQPKPGGRPRKTNMRQVVNAIFYLNREGCTWRALPQRPPPLEDLLQRLRGQAARGPRAPPAERRARPRPPRRLHRQPVGQD